MRYWSPLKLLALVSTFITGAVLMYSTKDFPNWGDPNSPANAHLSPHYIENAAKTTNTPNLVTAVLGDYRSYDTMLETIVIFTAGMAVAAVLRRPRK